ncbi:MAG: hypothetical protein ACMXYL_03845 [Candidatus Woesearchaeota archaeon]
MDKRITIAIVTCILFIAMAFDAAAIEFRHKDIGPFHLTQGETFTYDLNATNTTDGSQIVEDGTIIGYTTDDLAAKISSESLFILNRTTGMLTYIPSNKDSKRNINILFLLTDPTLEEEVFESLFVLFIIENVNDPPEIINQSPYNSTTNSSENTTELFIVNVTDPDFFHNSDNLTVEWYIDGSLNLTEENLSAPISPFIVSSLLSADFGFCDSGIRNITAIARDIEGLEDSFTWEVNVSNVNRPVTFEGIIPNISWNEGVTAQNHTPGWGLYDFFIDPDYIECEGEQQEILDFSFEGLENITAFVNETTGNITFQSPPYWRGEENVTITAYDIDGNATSNNFTITVLSSGYPPNITEIGDRNAAIGALFRLFVEVEDPDLPFGDNITYSDNSTLFDIVWYNITENKSYGLIEFVPSWGDEGLYSILIEVEDLYNFTDNQTFLLNISPNNPPILDSIANHNTTQDVFFQLNISAFDADGDFLTFYANSSLFGLPYDEDRELYKLHNINDTHSFLNFTPTNEQVGNYSIRFYVFDVLNATDTQTITLQVINVNDPPSFLEPLPQDLYAKINNTFVHFVYATDPDLMHGDILSYQSNDSIVNLTKLNNEEAVMIFYPTDADEGIRSVKLNVTDIEGLYDEWIFNLHILPPLPPTLNPIVNLTATENEEFITTITASDPNQDPLVFSFNSTLWSENMITINDSAVMINATYEKEHVGNHTINVTVTDIDGMSDSMTVVFEILEVDNPPEIVHPGNITFFEGILNNVTLTIIDLEGDNWTISSNMSDLINLSQINLTHANMTSTPTSAQIGIHSVLLTVVQEDDPLLNSSIIVNITVMHLPRAPTIIQSNPDPSIVIDTEEGSIISLNATIQDDDFEIEENITAEWFFNGLLVKVEYVEENNHTIRLDYDIGYCSDGNRTITLNLTDMYGLKNSTSWNLSIENVNRVPEFGIRRYYADTLSEGILSGMEEDSGYVVLEEFVNNGSIESPLLDFGQSFNKANVNITYNYIEIYGENITESDILISIRTGSNTNPSSWTMNWTDYQIAGDTIIMEEGNIPRRYAKIRIIVNDTQGNNPKIEGIGWKYEFGVQVLEASSVYSSWAALGDFFFDPDDECGVPTPKILGFVGNLITQVQVDNTDDMIVDLLTNPTPGTEVWYFNFSDGIDNTTSNNITFIITESEIPPITTPIPTSGGGGSTTTITQPVPVPVDVELPIPIDMIFAESVTIYDNDTMTIPITLTNTLNDTIYGIELYALSDNPNITFLFGQTFFDEIPEGENRTTTLTIESYRTYGSYEAEIHAIVTEPEFNATKSLFINSLEIGRHGEEEFNTRLTFVRDLLVSNPECIELSEQLDQASQALEQGNIQGGREIIDRVSETCRYLISMDRQEPFREQPTGFFGAIRNSPEQMLSYFVIIIVMNLLLAVMFAVFYSRPPKRGEPINTSQD